MELTRSEARSEIAEPPTRPGRFAAIYKVLQDAIDARAFPGCAFGILQNDRSVLTDALGTFTYGDNPRSVGPDTAFDIASLTKVVSTTAIAMLLYQRGQFDLDTRLGDLLPGFVVGRSDSALARRVTLRNLLAHNSGLPGYVEFFRTISNPAALFQACLQIPMEAEPGTRSEYSDPGFILLGKAIEMLTRESLADTAKREIFEPLGMSATRFRPAPQDRPMIPPTEEDTSFRHRIIQGEVQDENAWILDGVAGHAGLFSNVPDLLRFASQVLAGHRGSRSAANSSLFASQAIELFAKRQLPVATSCALGWDTPSPESSAGRHFSSHSIGHLAYSGCSLWIDLDADIAVVLLTNRTWPDRRNQAIKQIRPAFHNAVRESLETV